MKKRVVYFYDEDLANYSYDKDHPMKPHRISVTHDLILAYKLFPKMRVSRPKRATPLEMTKFHTDEYIQFLQTANKYNTEPDITKVLDIYNIDSDSPAFDGLFEFCQISAGGTISSAKELNSGKADIAINWAGGLHHAKKAEASGFCYVADCVLGILELLKHNDRVMYIDIDIHHGDGVEEAFYTSNRVLTVSFHKYGDDFFPKTGSIDDIGLEEGKGYSVNVPLNDGITDEKFVPLFKKIIEKLIEWYKPNSILLQCGADSLTGDRLGCFNLSIKGHAECVKYIKSFGLPLLVTGGGGYTVKNVARCWAYETSILLNEELENSLPYTPYLSYFGPDYNLQLNPTIMTDYNSPQYLNNILEKIDNQIKSTPSAPSIY